MSAEIAQLPTRAAIDRAWQRYVDLVSVMDGEPRLRTDVAHQQEIARAWQAWRDAFLASER